MPAPQDTTHHEGTEHHNGGVIGKGSHHIEKLLAAESPHVRMQEFKFHFKTMEKELKDAAGVVIEKVKEKRPTVTLMLPVPTFEGVVEKLASEEESDKKVKDYILDLIQDAIETAAREQVSADDHPVNKQEELDLSKLTLDFLSSQPASARRGGGIAKETWDAFVKDYVEIMPSLSGKSAEMCENTAKIMAQRFQTVKGRKDILKFLQGRLDFWFSQTANGEEFAEVYKFLGDKVQEFLDMDESKTLETLG